jgi:hypothetical protein
LIPLIRSAIQGDTVQIEIRRQTIKGHTGLRLTRADGHRALRRQRSVLLGGRGHDRNLAK